MIVTVQLGDGTPLVATERSTNVLNPDPRQPAADADLAKAKLEEMTSEILDEAKGQLDDWQRAIQRLTGD